MRQRSSRAEHENGKLIERNRRATTFGIKEAKPFLVLLKPTVFQIEVAPPIGEAWECVQIASHGSAPHRRKAEKPEPIRLGRTDAVSGGRTEHFDVDDA